MRRLLAGLVLVVLGLGVVPGLEAANITPTITVVGNGILLYTWSGMAGADTPLAANVSQCTGKLTIQASGTFGTTTITFTGSTDNSVFVGMQEEATVTAFSVTANALKALKERPLYAKPVLGGNGSALRVDLVCQKG